MRQKALQRAFWPAEHDTPVAFSTFAFWHLQLSIGVMAKTPPEVILQVSAPLLAGWAKPQGEMVQAPPKGG